MNDLIRRELHRHHAGPRTHIQRAHIQRAHIRRAPVRRATHSKAHAPAKSHAAKSHAATKSHLAAKSHHRAVVIRTGQARRSLRRYPAARLGQFRASSMLRQSGIRSVSSGGCADRRRPNCTSFDGLRAQTLAGVLALRDNSGCPIVISGGTETGHASGRFSHGHGYKLDIVPNACLNRYIKRHAKRIATRGDGAPQYRGNGVLYARESSHWDVTWS